MASSGIAIIRSPGPAPRQTMVILRAGPSGADHGHPDQLAIQLFSHGGRIAADPGTAGYGISLNETWYRQTASHGTVLLDGISQPPGSGRIARLEQRADGWLAEGEIAWPEDDPAAGLYGGVRMRRSITLLGGRLHDVFEVDCPGFRTIDWIFHIRGALEPGLALESTPGLLRGSCGYDELVNVRRLNCSPTASGDDPIRLTWRHENGLRTDLEFEIEPDEGVFIGSAPGNPAHDRHDVLVRRRPGARTVFETVLSVERIHGRDAAAPSPFAGRDRST